MKLYKDKRGIETALHMHTNDTIKNNTSGYERKITKSNE